MSDDDGIEMPTETLQEALVQMVTHAGPGGLGEDDLRAAIDELHEVYAAAMLWQAWRAGGIAVGARDGELTWHPASKESK